MAFGYVRPSNVSLLKGIAVQLQMVYSLFHFISANVHCMSRIQVAITLSWLLDSEDIFCPHCGEDSAYTD